MLTAAEHFGKMSDELRASERERMAPMREAARKAAFVQGYLRACAGALGLPLAEIADTVVLDWLRVADAAYVEFREERGPA